MLFTWNYQNVCVVFRQWHITSPLSLIISLLAVVAIVAGYEALREAIRQFEARTAKRIEGAPRKYSSRSPNPLDCLSAPCVIPPCALAKKRWRC
jgi:solute carrier family 31 (copper transporter), member 1